MLAPGLLLARESVPPLRRPASSSWSYTFHISFDIALTRRHYTYCDQLYPKHACTHMECLMSSFYKHFPEVTTSLAECPDTSKARVPASKGIFCHVEQYIDSNRSGPSLCEVTIQKKAHISKCSPSYTLRHRTGLVDDRVVCKRAFHVFGCIYKGYKCAKRK